MYPPHPPQDLRPWAKAYNIPNGGGGGGGGLDRSLYSDVFIGYFTANFVIKHVFLCIFSDYKKPARFCPYCQKSVSGGKLKRHIFRQHTMEEEVVAAKKKTHKEQVAFNKPFVYNYIYSFCKLAMRTVAFLTSNFRAIPWIPQVSSLGLQPVMVECVKGL